MGRMDRVSGRMRSTTLFLTLSVFGLASCSSQSETERPAEIHAPGCQVDLKQICQAYFDLPDRYLAGARLDSASIQRAPNPLQVFFPGPPAIVWCTYDRLKRKVVAAGLGQEQPLTDAQIADARAKGFCTEDHDKLRQAMIREEEKRLKSGPGGRTGTFLQPLNQQ
jgi:hypothetical protein